MDLLCVLAGLGLSSQSSLLGKVVPLHLLLMEESGFVLATSNDTLKRRPVSKIQKYMKGED
jgi:hypothetical protein